MLISHARSAVGILLLRSRVRPSKDCFVTRRVLGSHRFVFTSVRKSSAPGLLPLLLLRSTMPHSAGAAREEETAN
ncbi:unnamed protein product [Lampetra planeri]